MSRPKRLNIFEKPKTESGYKHEESGTCPVCKNHMDIALIGTEKVYWCEANKITIPIPV